MFSRPRRLAVNTALSAFAAERRAAAPVLTQRRCLRPDCVKSAPALMQRDRQTDRRTPYCYIDPAAHTMRHCQNYADVWTAYSLGHHLTLKTAVLLDVEKSMNGKMTTGYQKKQFYWSRRLATPVSLHGILFSSVQPCPVEQAVFFHA